MTQPVPPSGSESSAELPTRKPPRPWWDRVSAVVERCFIVFSLYVLSIGPMYWLWMAGQMGGRFRFVAWFYEPLKRLGELIPPFGDWLNWYVRWWIFG